jgi:hypothetical protein
VEMPSRAGNICRRAKEGNEGQGVPG